MWWSDEVADEHEIHDEVNRSWKYFWSWKFNKSNRRSRSSGVPVDQFCVARVFNHVRQLQSHRMDAYITFLWDAVFHDVMQCIQFSEARGIGPDGHGSCWNHAGWEEGLGRYLELRERERRYARDRTWFDDRSRLLMNWIDPLQNFLSLGSCQGVCGTLFFGLLWGP